ncbi:MAG: thioredoxin family protein [Candidatus Latescibacteria bacterium]|nr:thioredoxin family protein [Candidatus Latescibacterota bacterium]
MRKFLYCAVAIALAAGIGFSIGPTAEAGKNKALKLGTEAPVADIELKATDGKLHTLASVQGKMGTLIIFSCNSCPWAVKWESRVASIGNEYQDKGFGVIVINSNDPERASEDGFDEMVARAKTLAYEFPYVADSTSRVARAFGASRTPEVFLFNANGKLAYHGAIDDNPSDANAVEAAYLKDALNALISGKAILTTETKALGCGIKYSSDS